VDAVTLHGQLFPATFDYLILSSSILRCLNL
jgi:hypothetical protein